MLQCKNTSSSLDSRVKCTSTPRSQLEQCKPYCQTSTWALVMLVVGRPALLSTFAAGQIVRLGRSWLIVSEQNSRRTRLLL